MNAARNGRLEHTMLRAGLTPSALAERLQVVEKTVQRWLTGRCLPYPTHQYAVAALLNVDRRDIWPDETTDEPDTDLVALYPSRREIPPAIWNDLNGAADDMDILSSDLARLPASHPELVAAINERALQGGRIHLALLDPDLVDCTSTAAALETAALTRRTLREFDALLDADNAEHAQVRLHPGTDLTIFRFGSEMLVYTVLDGVADALTPTLHLRRMLEDGPFDRYLTHLQHMWQQASPVPKHRPDPQSGTARPLPPLLTRHEERARTRTAPARAS